MMDLYSKEASWRCSLRTSRIYISVLNKGKKREKCLRAAVKNTSGSNVGTVCVLASIGVGVFLGTS